MPKRNKGPLENPYLTRPGMLLLALISVLWPISNNTEALAEGMRGCRGY